MTLMSAAELSKQEAPVIQPPPDIRSVLGKLFKAHISLITPTLPVSSFYFNNFSFMHVCVCVCVCVCMRACVCGCDSVILQ